MEKPFKELIKNNKKLNNNNLVILILNQNLNLNQILVFKLPK